MMRSKLILLIIGIIFLSVTSRPCQARDIGWLENPFGYSTSWEEIGNNIDVLLSPNESDPERKKEKFQDLITTLQNGLLFQRNCLISERFAILGGLGERVSYKSTTIEILKHLPKLYEAYPFLINPLEMEEIKETIFDFNLPYLKNSALKYLYMLPHPGMFDFYEKISDRYLEEGLFLEASFYLYLLKEYSLEYKNLSIEHRDVFLKKLEVSMDRGAIAIKSKILGKGQFHDYRTHLLEIYFSIYSKHPKTKELFERYKISDFISLGRMFFYSDSHFRFVDIPSGSFLMGSLSTEKDRQNDETPHEVTLTHEFKMMKDEVTQLLWFRVMGENPSDFKEKKQCESSFRIEVNKEGKEIPMCPYHPVENVSWEEAVFFANQMSYLRGLKPCYKVGLNIHINAACKGYRLPTEAEWEYAARSGTQTAYFFGDSPDSMNEYAWFKTPQTNKVLQLKPNAWGLHDMYGNVAEWVQDFYGEYGNNPVIDPVGPASGSYRVVRGGSWDYVAQDLRSANRGNYGPDGRGSNVGFRLVRTKRD